MPCQSRLMKCVEVSFSHYIPLNLFYFVRNFALMLWSRLFGGAILSKTSQADIVGDMQYSKNDLKTRFYRTCSFFKWERALNGEAYMSCGWFTVLKRSVWVLSVRPHRFEHFRCINFQLFCPLLIALSRWFLYVSFLSMINPTDLVNSFALHSLPLRLIVDGIGKSVWSDFISVFDPFTFIFQLKHQLFILVHRLPEWSDSLADKFAWTSTGVFSAYLNTLCGLITKSLINNMKRIGDKTLPWGRPI